MMDRPLILASGSPRRRQLLGELGIPFRVIVSDEPEDITPGLDPEAQTIALAERKARAVAARVPEGLVLGADTIVVLDSDLLGKPVDDADAAAMLRRLSGRAHQVVTGVGLVDAATGETRALAATSTVRLRSLSDAEIATYVATGEPLDKAGGYAIQGIGRDLIAGFDGCFNTIVGLPLCEVTTLLANAGTAIPATWSGCRLSNGGRCPRGL